MFRNWRNVLFAAIAFGVTATPCAQGVESGKTKTGSGGATFHKGWKKRDTPRNPVWGPSSCGGGGKVKKKTTVSCPTRPKKTDNAAKRKTRNEESLRTSTLALEKLREIHALQTDLVKNAKTMTPAQRQTKIAEIRNAYPFVIGTISKTAGFPFPAHLWKTEEMLQEIRRGKVPSEFSGAAGKSDIELLNAIQRRQLECFRKTVEEAARQRR